MRSPRLKPCVRESPGYLFIKASMARSPRCVGLRFPQYVTIALPPRDLFYKIGFLVF